MPPKGTTIVIKKKKGGGGHGHHGGAWKVAFADFMTAMMAFFLVMWLMGSDEETKAAISHYFNHPDTPWKAGRDPSSDEVHPMGENAGPGESIQNGREGQMPEDMSQNPVRPVQMVETYRDIQSKAQQAVDGQAYAIDVDIEHLKFSIPERLLFERGETELKNGAAPYLDRLAGIFKNFNGYVHIEGRIDSNSEALGKHSNAFEFTLARAVSVMNYLVEHDYVPENKL